MDLRFWEGMEVERMVGVVGMRQPGCFAILTIGGTSCRCRFIFIPMLVPVSGNFSSHLISAKRHCNFFFQECSEAAALSKVGAVHGTMQF